ncbi:uncharacterized protein LOC110983151 [Acanthaster planci]|uniref:Uncharacterized protein LOC110983151 n=1 Tax=Acanthaster planci TaxID=133434 RepID=A0A8B7YWZ4_ACAPL|nr:uncharacterized protein LOC110983151 [Acanthaster planci]
MLTASPEALAGNVVLVVAGCCLILLVWVFMLKRARAACRDVESGGCHLTDLNLQQLSKQISTGWLELALHLGFKACDTEVYRADNKDNVCQQGFKMLVAWRNKQTDYKLASRKLRKALSEVGRQDVVRFMETLSQTGQAGSSKRPKTGRGDAAQRAADKCEEVLRNIYATTGSYVQMLPWVDDDQKHIMEIYTKLQLEKSDDDLMGEVTLFEDILRIKTRDGHPVKRAILRGGPGMGKTTLFDKVAYDWALGQNDALKKYKLVFVLKMHSLKQQSDLVDGLFDQLLDETKINKADLASFITSRASKILFLLDGFDEFTTAERELDEKEFGSLLKMLNRKGEYKDCWAFVTTRPSRFDNLTKKYLIQRPFALVNVLGFDWNDIRTYVDKFYIKDPSKTIGLLERIESSNVLSDLAKSPMLLLLMCLLWRVNSNLPDTMSHLYDEAFHYIFKRKIVDMSAKQMSSHIAALGKVAFDGLFSSNQKLSFEDDDFDSDVFEKAIQAGILTSERVQKEKSLHIFKNVYFIHKTFQEFCAGKYYQGLNAEEAAKKCETFVHQNLHLGGFEYLLRFCCGDNCGPNTQSILHMLLERYVEKGNLGDERLCIALNCFFESRSEKLPPNRLIQCILSNSLILRDIRSDVLTSFMYFLDRVTDPTKGGSKTFLHRVLQLNTSGSRVQQFGEGFAHYVKEMRCLHEFTFAQSSFSETEVAKCLDNKLFLAKVNIRGKGHDEAEDYGAFDIDDVYGFDSENGSDVDIEDDTNFDNSEMTSLDSIMEPLSRVPNLHELHLSSTSCGSVNLWSSLAKNKHLQRVHLGYCDFAGNDIPHIADALGEMPKLRDLDLSGCGSLGGSGEAWSHLAKITTVQKVNLACCKLTGDDIPHIAKALYHMPNLIHLDISGNNTLHHSGQALTNLAKLNHVQVVNAGSCNLTEGDIPHFAVALGNMTNLVELDLSGNRILGDSGVAWYHLAKMKHIQKVYLGSCNLTADDIPHIANALTDMPTCCELDLSFNGNLAGSGKAWSSLAEIKYIQRLSVGSCNLTGDDIPHIASALRKLPQLVELDLSGNEILGGCGAAWSHLEEIKRIQTVHLSNCNLTSNDIPHIAKALLEMPKLVELDLSGNGTLSGSGSAWCHLAKIRHIHRVDLGNCGFTEDDILYITDALSEMPKLTELDLSTSGSVIGSSEAWSHLAKIKHTQKVFLRECSLTEDAILHIAGALSKIPTISELDLSKNETLVGSGGAWCHLAKIKHTRTVRLEGCNLMEDDIPHIANALSDMPKLEELDLSGNETLGGSGETWSHMAKIKHIQRLKLVSCNLTGRDIPHIADALSDMQELVELNMSGNGTLLGSGGAWSSLAKLKHIDKICLEECSLIEDDILHIADALSNIPTISELDLSSNETLGSSGESWSHLAKIKQIQKIDLWSCNLKGDDVAHIASALSKMPNLTELDLSGNVSLRGSCGAWSELATVKHIKKVNLRECNLTGDDMPHIADALSNLSDLVTLDLSGNPALSSSSEGWSYFAKINRIQKVCLQKCNLTGDDIPRIADALKNVPALEELDLSYNVSLSGIGEKSSHLLKLGHIQKVNLGSCNLTRNDIPQVADTLGKMQRLVELDLSGNETLGGSGDTWFHLAKIGHLQNLDLGSCNLTGGDIPHITNALNKMPKLVELDLSANETLVVSESFWSNLANIKLTQQLKLKNCRLTGHDIRQMAEALKVSATSLNWICQGIRLFLAQMNHCFPCWRSKIFKGFL